MKKFLSTILAMLFVFTLLVVSPGSRAAEATADNSNIEEANPPDQVGLYDVYEITYEITDNVPSTNEAKSALDFSATFTGPVNEKITLPGFWAGDNQWKIRFAPTHLGSWTWITASSNPELDGLTGSVVSVPSGNKGFIEASDQNPYTFKYSDGTPYYMWGNTGYLLLMQALEGPGVAFEYTNPDDPSITHTMTTQDWHEFVDKSQEFGMNKIRFLVTMWNWGYDFGTRWFPWENCTVANPQFAAFNQAYWEKLDEMVQYMQDQGMVAELIIFPDYANWASDDPGMYYMTPADEQLYMKFAAARYSAYSNVIWSMANEYFYNERARYGGRVPDQWGRDVGGYMAGIDPYRIYGRLLSIHNRTKMTFNFMNDAWPTHFVVQVGPRITPRPTYQNHPSLWGNDSILKNWGYNKPVANDEYGYCDNIDVSRAAAREAAWGVAIGGGYGTYGEWNTDLSWDPWAMNTGSLLGFWNDDPSQGDLKVLLDFMQGIDYVSMSPNNALITAKPTVVYAYMLANQGKEYVMYAAEGSGGSFTLTLKKGIYDAWWYNTTTGQVVQTEPRFHIKNDSASCYPVPGLYRRYRS